MSETKTIELARGEKKTVRIDLGINCVMCIDITVKRRKSDALKAHIDIEADTGMADIRSVFTYPIDVDDESEKLIIREYLAPVLHRISGQPNAFEAIKKEVEQFEVRYV